MIGKVVVFYEIKTSNFWHDKMKKNYDATTTLSEVD